MNISNASSSDSESGHSVLPDSLFRFVLEARGLTKKFGRVVALDEAHFELRRGEILGVIGDNGAGKSSLIKALTGLSARTKAKFSSRGSWFLLPRPSSPGLPASRPFIRI